MKTVTFAKEYRHPLPNHSEAIYPAGATLEVSNEVAAAAKKAGALKPEPKKETKNGIGSSEAD